MCDRSGLAFWIVISLITVLTGAATACIPSGAPSPTPSPSSVEGAATAAPSDSPPGETPSVMTSSSPSPTSTPPPETSSERQGNADVVHVRAVQTAGPEPGEGEGTWTFRVTVEHPDTGWDDYADGWDVVTPDGNVLKPDPDADFTRTLLHPHVDEQPFTRGQSGIVIPEEVTEVRVRAHDIVDGYGGKEVIVHLTESSGPGFEVERD